MHIENLFVFKLKPERKLRPHIILSIKNKEYRFDLAVVKQHNFEVLYTRGNISEDFFKCLFTSYIGFFSPFCFVPVLYYIVIIPEVL